MYTIPTVGCRLVYEPVVPILLSPIITPFKVLVIYENVLVFFLKSGRHVFSEIFKKKNMNYINAHKLPNMFSI